MVHQIIEGVSLLAPLKQLEASWGYEQVAYPYACCKDETKKFQVNYWWDGSFVSRPARCLWSSLLHF